MDDQKNIHRISQGNGKRLFRILQAGYLIALLIAALWLVSEINVISKEENKLKSQAIPTLDSYTVIENIEIPVINLREKIYLYQTGNVEDAEDIRDNMEVVRAQFGILFDVHGTLYHFFNNPEAQNALHRASNMFEKIAVETDAMLNGNPTKNQAISDLKNLSSYLRDVNRLFYKDQIKSYANMVSDISGIRKIFRFIINGWMVLSSIFILTVFIDQANSRRLMHQKEDALNRKRIFISMFNHEIRNPLQAMSASIENLCSVIEEIKIPGAGGQFEEIQSLSKKINDQLEVIEVRSSLFGNYARLESGQIRLNREDVNIKIFVTNIVHDFLEAGKRKGIAINCAVAKNIGMIRLDRHKTDQILRNLIDNAIKYTVTGSITVSVSRELNYKQHIRFDVTDTGIGLAKEDIKNIFDPFVRRSNKMDGYYGRSIGLGLTIVRLLVKILDGEIEVRSEYGRGTTFTVKLPT